MKSVNFGLIGASGRMGKEIETCMIENGHKKVYSYDEHEEICTGVPEVLIDFSQPEVLAKSVAKAHEFSCALIVGTTGLSLKDEEELKKTSENIPVVLSYNYSIGIQLMLRCVEMLEKQLPEWDVEISETHHRFKKDKPSGTALMLKKALNREVNISSLRLGNMAGEHTVSFGGLGEVLSITHHATSRRTFAEGVLRSVEFIVKQEKGFFSFKDVISS